ncbi:helicase HerA domain-containing protein [Streptomyces aurantiacus]|uniref:helicase HerA domain-containing protein n=1 Tax=Streptomyces aurantiacus TaxID=47760 RepID=UPI000AB44ED9|nr:DUF87 domain-containing protein [Streptomyces aurantiacus]
MATVQLDFVPSAVTPAQKLWTPAEPLAWDSKGIDDEVSLSNLADRIPGFASTRTKIQSDLIDFQNRRLAQILSFLEKAAVDLCVFPEYAFIAHASTLQIFAGFAPRITIVAGLGVPRTKGTEALKVYTDDVVAPGANVAAVFSDSDCYLVAKKHMAEGEEIEPGDGPRIVEVSLGGTSIRLGVAICKDYLVSGPNLGGFDSAPDVLAIPAYTNNTEAFHPEAPRDFPRVLANHSRFGGSTVFAAGCQDHFVEQGIPRPIPAEAEGILAVEWHGAPEKPTSLLKGRNRVSVRSAMVSRSDGDAAASIVRAFQALAHGHGQAPTSDDTQEEQRWLDYLKGKPRLALVADAVLLYRRANNDDLVTPDLVTRLSRHLVTPETQSVAEHRRQAHNTVSKQIRRSLQHDYVDDLATDQLLLNAASKYAPARGDDGGGRAPEGGDAAEPEIRWHFSVGLGRFDSDEAVATLSDQQDLLLTFARSAPAGSRIVHRLETDEDPASGNIAARYSVNFFGPSDDESVQYFTGLQRISRSVFRRGWMTYTSQNQVITGHQVHIVPGQNASPKVREDHGFLVDVLRATGGGCVLEMSGLRGSEAQDDAQNETTQTPLTLMDPANGKGARWFLSQPSGRMNLGTRVTLTTPERNDPLATLVGTALFDGDFTIMEASGADGAGLDGAGRVDYSVEVAHRILHPPHGHIEGRGLGRRHHLFIPVNDFAVLGEGAVIGTASAARPFVDDEQEIRIPDLSRLVHTYVIGRTGVGKTNTLKNLALHDLGRPGPVIIVDPHGDLYDYSVRHATSRDPLVALDFTGERTPSLNPIYLDAQDEEGILANIEELIEIVVNAQYYEWAGPRFSDMLRLCLHSLVAAADEKNGEWARLGDVTKLVEDKQYRRRVVRRLGHVGRQDLVKRWNTHERMKEPEQAELEQWFVSKFGEFRRPGVLASATSGKPSINLEASLRDGAALLVKVPQVALGVGASNFLGSFIVERVLRYTMSGAFLGSDVPAMLIVDEFQNFVSTSFVTLIPEARKFNLGITVANQTLSQLSAFSVREGIRSESLSQTVLGNVGNMIIQGVGHNDAKRLAPEVGLDSADLSRIAKYSGLVTLTVNGERLDPFTVRMSDSNERPGVVAAAVALSQANDALERAGKGVIVPKVDRPNGAEGNGSDEKNDGRGGDGGTGTGVDASGRWPFADHRLEERRQEAGKESRGEEPDQAERGNAAPARPDRQQADPEDSGDDNMGIL